MKNKLILISFFFFNFINCHITFINNTGTPDENIFICWEKSNMDILTNKIDFKEMVEIKETGNFYLIVKVPNANCGQSVRAAGFIDFGFSRSNYFDLVSKFISASVGNTYTISLERDSKGQISNHSKVIVEKNNYQENIFHHR